MINVLRGVERASVGATPEERINAILGEIAANPEVQTLLAELQPKIDALTPAQQFRLGMQCGRDLGITTLEQVRSNPMAFLRCVEQQLNRPRRKGGGGAVLAVVAVGLIGGALAFGMSRR